MSVQWYQWPSIERQLVTFGKSFLGPYAFAVRLEDDRSICPSGMCDFGQRTITVNPRAFPGPAAHPVSAHAGRAGARSRPCALHDAAGGRDPGGAAAHQRAGG